MAGTAVIAWLTSSNPAGLAIISNTGTSNNNASATSLAGVTAGALMLLTCASADDHALAATVGITGTSLTWTRIINPFVVGSHHGQVEIWTAPCPAGGTVSPTCTWSGGTTAASSSVLYAITGQEVTPAGNSGGQEGGAAPSVTINTTRANSIIFCVSSDWNATAGAKTLRDTATSVLDHDLSPTVYRGYHYYKQATSVASYTEGISAPSTMAANTAIYEIRTP